MSGNSQRPGPAEKQSLFGSFCEALTMADHRQASLVAFATVLVVALAVVHHAEAQCDATTCVGPVFSSFTAPDCVAAHSTGFYELVGGGSTSKCDAIGADDYAQYYGAFCRDGYVVDGYFLDSACSDSIFSSAQQAGKCFNMPDGTSVLRLCSINDTWSLAENPNPNNFPHFDNHQRTCDSPNDCPPDMTVYATTYESTTCDPLNATHTSGYVNSANFSLGVCFYNPQNGAAIMVTCGEENLEIVEYRSGEDGCTGQPTSFSLKGRSCRPLDYEKRAVYPHLQVFCPYTSPPLPAPTGSANMLSISAALMVLCAFFFAIVLL
jgi:hypothetical protein